MRRGIESKLNATLNRIQAAICHDDTQFKDALGMTDKQWKKYRQDQDSLGITNLMKIAEYTDLSVERICRGEVDFKALAKRYAGDQLALPEKYKNPAHHFSRARSILSIMSYLELIRGPVWVRGLYRRLQVHPESFANPDAFISPYLVTDLLTEMRMLGFQSNEITQMGRQSVAINKNTPIVTLLSKVRTPQALYSTVHDRVLTQHYDHLFYYELNKLSSGGLTMKTRPRMEAHEALKSIAFGHRETCLFKQGVYLSFLDLSSQTPHKLVETQCMYQGDSCCTYELTWDKSHVADSHGSTFYH